ncbi:MAG: GNAT family N-acetyltransferase [Alphaproteobacteria bacterium]|nr:GNAT family N-acetyltransferase [Alphaproteobacteria bacterium]
MNVQVRAAIGADADAVNAIYNPLILSSPATFETEPYSREDRAALIESRRDDPRHPFLAADIDGQLVGYAFAAPFDPRPGYASSVKTSVFVAPAAHGRGVGRALYAELLPKLATAGLHRAYALIVVPNESSEALHRSAGFRRVALLNEVGFKLGNFHDVAWYEAILSDYRSSK